MFILPTKDVHIQMFYIGIKKLRNTTTGISYEDRIKQLLEQNTNHRVRIRQNIGKKRNGGNHIVDIVLNEKELVSLKYQKTTGTAEEKIPFEVIKLQQAIDDYHFVNATIVLAGNDKAWTLKDYYLSGDFKKYMNCPDVRVISHEEFLNEYIGEGFVEVTNKTINQENFSEWFLI